MPVFYLIITKSEIHLYTVLVGVQTMQIFVQKTCLLFFMLSWIFLKFAGLTANHAVKKKNLHVKGEEFGRTLLIPKSKGGARKKGLIFLPEQTL